MWEKYKLGLFCRLPDDWFQDWKKMKHQQKIYKHTTFDNYWSTNNKKKKISKKLIFFSMYSAKEL